MRLCRCSGSRSFFRLTACIPDERIMRMKAALAVLTTLVIFASCPLRLLAQSNPSKANGSAAALKQWISEVREQAAKGSADAQETLGNSYYLGIGVTQDYVRAAYWFRRAAEQNDPGAQYGIGTLYLLGRGVPQDHSQAYFWLSLAAARSSQKNLLGTIPVAKERDAAASHLTKAETLRIQGQTERWFESHPLRGSQR